MSDDQLEAMSFEHSSESTSAESVALIPSLGKATLDIIITRADGTVERLRPEEINVTIVAPE
jgi:hypothetical protein